MDQRRWDDEDGVTGARYDGDVDGVVGAGDDGDELLNGSLSAIQR